MSASPEEIAHVIHVTQGIIKMYKAFYQLRVQAMLTEIEMMEIQHKIDEFEKKDIKSGIAIYEKIIEEYDVGLTTFQFDSNLKIENLKMDFFHLTTKPPSEELKRLQSYRDGLETKYLQINELVKKKTEEIADFQKKTIPTLPQEIQNYTSEVEEAMKDIQNRKPTQ